MAKMRGIHHRSQPATIVRGDSILAGGDEMAASGKRVCGVDRAHADKAVATRIGKARARRKHHADRVFFARHHFAKAHIQRGGLAVKLIPRDMAFFDAHHAKRFGAVNHGVKFCARRRQFADHRVTVAGGHGDFIGKLAREGDAEQARAQAAADGDFAAGHIGESVV